MDGRTDTGEPPRDFPEIAETPLSSWIGLAVLVLLGLLAWIDRSILALMVDLVRRDLHITEFQFGLLQGLGFALFYSVFGLPLGWAADRFSRRWLIYLSASIWSIAACCCGMAQNFWQMLLGRFGVGFGEAGLMPASFSLIGDIFGRDRQTLALTIFSFSAAIGPALATMIGGSMLGSGRAATMILPIWGEIATWRGVLIVTGLPGLLLAPLVFVVIDRRRKASAAEERKEPVIAPPIGAFLQSHRRFFLCHFVGFGCLSLIAYASAAWTPAYLMRVRGWEPRDVGLLLPLFSNLPAILGSLAGALFVDRAVARGQHTMFFDYYVVGSIVVGLGGVLAFAGGGIGLTVVGLASAFVFLAAGGVSMAALQIVTPPPLRGQIAALFLLITTLSGASLGPPIVAAFTQFVLADDRKVGLGLALTYLTFSPVAALSFWFGRPALRRAYVDQGNFVP